MKPYPWKCPKCRTPAVSPARVEYTANLDHDGRTYAVTLPDLEVHRCANCGNLQFTDASHERMSRALRDRVGLLQPEQIRQNREALGLTQKELAAHLGVAEATLSRWETGTQIQQRSLDRFLRAYFAFAQVRQALADEGRIPELGVTDRHTVPA